MPTGMSSNIAVCITVCPKAVDPRKNVHNTHANEALQNEITHLTASTDMDELQKNVFIYCEA
jgi:succinate dehydrogenase/fumarate reductase-like Fe-S protein